jgi:hypothetical protein
MDRSGFGVVRAINQPPNSRVNQGSRAHHTRLNCSKQVTVNQAVVAHGRSSFTECQDFRVSSWVLIRYITIPATANNRPVRHYNRPDRNFANLERPLRTAQSFFHPEFMAVIVRAVSHERYCSRAMPSYF